MGCFIPIPAFEMVIVGGTGDLALNKLLPALFQLELDDRLHEDGVIILTGQDICTTEDYIDKLEKKFIFERFNRYIWEKFCQRIIYLKLDIQSSNDYQQFKNYLSRGRSRIFYLATPPNLFGPFCFYATATKLITPETRLVIEKPLGHDLSSFLKIDKTVTTHFSEEQIYRIDHYLGKETVQNLLALRFANSIFEPLWNNKYINHVQITVAEKIGVESRAQFYAQTGALRDMVQNHLLQLLCLTAMEPPQNNNANSIRDEKLKILKALKPIEGKDVLSKTVRGAYSDHFEIESYVALEAQIDNWRWGGVPFYMRTGKCLTKRFSEIVIEFKPVPHALFDAKAGQLQPNLLVIHLQPNDSIKLHIMSKTPGPGLELKPVALNLNFADSFGARIPDAYERLLMDVMRGIPTLFMRHEEVLESWRWIDGITKGWRDHSVGLEQYKPHSMGPDSAECLIKNHGSRWYNLYE
jgi:glucose-6-phosphate 1-dehydrogenase